jgi:hypothetical protein
MARKNKPDIDHPRPLFWLIHVVNDRKTYDLRYCPEKAL